MIAARTHAVASEAYDRVRAHARDPKKNEYGTLAHKLPGMILENGLAQAIGFLVAKGQNEHKALLADLNAVLRSAGTVTTADGEAFHELVIGSNLNESMQLTRRSLEASAWIKRYAQGVLQVGATGEQTADNGMGGGE